MINKEKDLENLHSELTQKLLDKIRSPEVTASELSGRGDFWEVCPQIPSNLC